MTELAPANNKLSTMYGIEICFPSLSLRQNFTYTLSDSYSLSPGMRVEAPLRKRFRLGFVVSILSVNQFVGDRSLKSIAHVLDQKAPFPKPLWEMLKFGAQYYHVPLNALLYYLLPTNLLQGASINPYTRGAWYLNKAAPAAIDGLQSTRFSRRQKELLRRLELGPVHIDGTDNAFQEQADLKRWLRKKLVKYAPVPHPFSSWKGRHLSWNPPPFELSSMQTKAVHAILPRWNQFGIFLLEGVTGSGKTEVYFSLIRQALVNQQRVIYLAPEIGLLAPIEAQLNERFAQTAPIVTIHSERTMDAKWLAWQAIHAGAHAILLGTRSALFMPVANCGLIIIDEEHDVAYQQTEPFPYHTRSLAIMLAKYWNCPIILGSATPAFESLHAARSGKYVHLKLPQRTNGQPLPRFQVIDLNQEKSINGLSARAIQTVKIAVDQGEQVLFFLNRRGYAPALYCTHCKQPLRCPGCRQPYNTYLSTPSCRCHRCCRTRSLPSCCPQCGQATLVTVGMGTEQLEKIVKLYFPHLPVTRIDRDCVTNATVREKLLKQLEEPGARLIVSTQMFSKGYHFPRLTTAVLCAFDQAFFSYDFRALEHLAQLCIQVAGRTGRGNRPGLVLLQTHQAKHPFFELCSNSGYAAFTEQQLLDRQAARLPPFSAQALFVLETARQPRGQQMLSSLKKLLLDVSDCPQGIRCFGPLPALYAQRNGRFRWQLLVEHDSRKQLQLWLVRIQPLFARHRQQVRAGKWQLIIDPIDFS